MRSHEILTGVDRGMLMHPVSSAPYGPAVGRPLRPPPPRSRPGESRAVYSQQVAYAPHNNVPGRHSSHSSTDQTSSGGYTLSGGHDVQSHERMHPPRPQQQQRPSGRPPPPFDGRREQGSLQHQHQARPSVDLTNEYIAMLREQGFTAGLAKALASNADSFDLRLWIVDNSGSMQIGDGHRVVELDGRIFMQPVTRWEELQDTVIYHAQMAALLHSYTKFRLLNDPGPAVGRREVAVGVPGRDADGEIRQARLTMTRTKPDGVTPLARHVWEVQTEIREMLPALQRTGRRVAVILATDGLPTDDQGYGGEEITQQFIQSLRALEGLPVWMVIRLCTDEDNVVEFYNNLDGMLELSLEVLDDFLGESAEVQSKNPWLNYALPMHRCRELGYHDRLFDLIDERALTKGELREFCVLLFGTSIEDIPDPLSEWKSFVSYVEERLTFESPQWNPNKKKVKPWISVKKLNRIYNERACTIM